MKVKDIKKQINGILGNSLRCILPSYWFKKIFNIIVDKIEELEYNSDNTTSITVDSSIVEGSTNPVQSKVIKAYVDDLEIEMHRLFGLSIPHDCNADFNEDFAI